MYSRAKFSPNATLPRLAPAERRRLQAVARQVGTTPARAARALLRTALGYPMRAGSLEFRLLDVCNELT